MRIAFADFISWDYRVDTPYERPLGGSQSSLCYLAEALAAQGHDVSLLSATTKPGRCRGVRCVSVREELPASQLRALDALVVLNSAAPASAASPTAADWRGGHAAALRAKLAAKARLILWATMATDEPAMQALRDPSERQAYDAVVTVSEWQRGRFEADLGVEPARLVVLRNAVSPAFIGLFSDRASFASAKSRPPVLAYTSTPFRGLTVLLDVLPRIRAAVPGTTLKVFSSMGIYQVPKSDDEAKYGWIYRKCRETEGAEHVGSVPQPELARQLRSVAVLAYPCLFSETSCIGVMEALASGASIVTSDLAALPETTAGFAALVPTHVHEASRPALWQTRKLGANGRLPIIGDNQIRFEDRFVEATVKALRAWLADDESALEQRLRRSVAHANRELTWAHRAQEWSAWLGAGHA